MDICEGASEDCRESSKSSRCSLFEKDPVVIGQALKAFGGTIGSYNIKKEDNINPSHYKKNGLETIDYLEAFLTRDEFIGYLKGNSIKYLSRANEKGGIEDLKKAKWYNDRLVNFKENNKK